MAEPPPTLVVRGLSKRFGGIVALEDVDLDVRRGEVVAIAGENGAGKSTLVNVLSGMCRADAGTIVLDDVRVRIDTPARARALGIATVFQGLALCENLDVVKNLFLGREIGSFWMDERAMERQSTQLLRQIFSTVSRVRDRVGDLSGGQRQTVAIARTLLGDPSIVILDEPTAALGDDPAHAGAQPDRAAAGARAGRDHDLAQPGRHRGGRRPCGRPAARRNNGVFEVASATTEQVHQAMTGAAPAATCSARAPRVGKARAG